MSQLLRALDMWAILSAKPKERLKKNAELYSRKNTPGLFEGALVVYESDRP